MTVDRGCSDDESSQYPVNIDPTVKWKDYAKIRDAYGISGSYAGSSFYYSSTKAIFAGQNGTVKHHTYIFFRNLLSKVKD